MAGESPLSAPLSPRVGRGATASTVLCSITGWVIPGGFDFFSLTFPAEQ